MRSRPLKRVEIVVYPARGCHVNFYMRFNKGARAGKILGNSGKLSVALTAYTKLHSLLSTPEKAPGWKSITATWYSSFLAPLGLEEVKLLQGNLILKVCLEPGKSPSPEAGRGAFYRSSAYAFPALPKTFILCSINWAIKSRAGPKILRGSNSLGFFCSTSRTPTVKARRKSVSTLTLAMPC